MTVVHIAGLPVVVDGTQQRQRCSWCGAVLLDNDLARMMVPVGQEGGEPATWEVGSLVAVDGGISYVVEPVEDKLPDEACARLPHDVTGHRSPT